MQKPRIHLNGSGRQRLYGQFTDAAAALRKAIDALTEAEPNARDYYVIGEGAFERARAEHAVRIAAVTVVRKEMEELTEAISEDEYDKAR